jgi:carbonic anhydrase
MDVSHPFGDLLEANRAYAERYSVVADSGWAQKGLAVVTCIDTRIDPLGMLGLRPGDAKIIRNAGARVTDDVLRSLALATRTLGVDRIAVVQHTDCKLAATSEDEIVGMFAELGVDASGAVWLVIDDQDAVLAADVAKVRASPLVGPVAVQGFVYDVRTGLLEERGDGT